MIGRKHRFHGHNSLRSVYSRGITVRNNYCALKYAPTRSGKPYRAAVVVSKKVSKSAVVRNRIRRRLYEVIRTSDFAQGSFDIVLTAFSEQLATMPTEELRSNLMDIFTQVHNTTPTESKDK